jgi:hypothetical protein
LDLKELEDHKEFRDHKDSKDHKDFKVLLEMLDKKDHRV